MHVVGAGTVGILTLIAIKALTKADHVIVAAKHQRQRAAASMAGADDVVRPEHAVKAVRRTGPRREAHPGARDGVPARWRRRRDRVHGFEQRARPRAARRRRRAGASSSPASRGAAPISPRSWFRELELAGAYTSGVEDLGKGVTRPTFEMAIELASNLPMLEELVGATYPLDRWRDALDHAMAAGTLGTFKVAFAPQT